MVGVSTEVGAIGEASTAGFTTVIGFTAAVMAGDTLGGVGGRR